MHHQTRTVLCHYHIFKNSGVSFDALLAQNYQQRYIHFDGPFPFFQILQDQLRTIIERKTEIVALSSHQIRLPTPRSLDFAVLPIVFVRHPILRVRSIYQFNRQSNAETPLATAAAALDFDTWIDHCFKNTSGMNNISNAQTKLLAGVHQHTTLTREHETHHQHDLNQAMRNLHTVELLARTDHYNDDIKRFPIIMKRHGIDFQLHESPPMNTTSDDIHEPLENRIQNTKSRLSESNFQRLIQANQQDLQLFNYATDRIEQESR